MKRNFLSIPALTALAARKSSKSSKKIEWLQKALDTHDLNYGDRINIQREMVRHGDSELHHKILDSGDATFFDKATMLQVHDKKRAFNNLARVTSYRHTHKVGEYDDSVTDRILDMHLHGTSDDDKRMREYVAAYGTQKHLDILKKHGKI
jgi:hypothetical protein